MMEKSNRMARELETRETYERPKQWMPAQLLPDPKPEEGYRFRWIRISAAGSDDPKNYSSKLAEGWEPVRASDHPEIRLFATSQNKFTDSIEVGGLLLCKTPVEFTQQRDAYYQKQTDQQMSSVDNTYMRESNPKMPLFKERSSEVTFGRRT